MLCRLLDTSSFRFDAPHSDFVDSRTLRAIVFRLVCRFEFVWMMDAKVRKKKKKKCRRIGSDKRSEIIQTKSIESFFYSFEVRTFFNPMKQPTKLLLLLWDAVRLIAGEQIKPFSRRHSWLHIIHLDVIVALFLFDVFTHWLCVLDKILTMKIDTGRSNGGGGREHTKIVGDAAKGESDFSHWIARERSLNQTSNSIWPKRILCLCMCACARLRLFAFDAAAAHHLLDGVCSTNRLCVNRDAFVTWVLFCSSFVSIESIPTANVSRAVRIQSMSNIFHSLPPIFPYFFRFFLSSAYYSNRLEIVNTFVQYLFIYLLHSYGLLKTHRSLKTLQIFEYRHFSFEKYISHSSLRTNAAKRGKPRNGMGNGYGNGP